MLHSSIISFIPFQFLYQTLVQATQFPDPFPNYIFPSLKMVHIGLIVYVLVSGMLAANALPRYFHRQHMNDGLSLDSLSSNRQAEKFPESATSISPAEPEYTSEPISHGQLMSRFQGTMLGGTFGSETRNENLSVPLDSRAVHEPVGTSKSIISSSSRKNFMVFPSQFSY